MSSELKQKMWQAMADSPYLMMGLVDSYEHSEPMRAQLDEDADREFWFYTTKENRIAKGGKTMAQFVSPDHELFACISGELVKEKDPAVVDRFWTRQVASWYQEGRDDDSLLMLRFELDDIEIWTMDPTFAGMLKLSVGAKVEPKELGEHEMMKA